MRPLVTTEHPLLPSFSTSEDGDGFCFLAFISVFSIILHGLGSLVLFQNTCPFISLLSMSSHCRVNSCYICDRMSTMYICDSFIHVVELYLHIPHGVTTMHLSYLIHPQSELSRIPSMGWPDFPGKNESRITRDIKSRKLEYHSQHDLSFHNSNIVPIFRHGQSPGEHLPTVRPIKLLGMLALAMVVAMVEYRKVTAGTQVNHSLSNSSKKKPRMQTITNSNHSKGLRAYVLPANADVGCEGKEAETALLKVMYPSAGSCGTNGKDISVLLETPENRESLGKMKGEVLQIAFVNIPAMFKKEYYGEPPHPVFSFLLFFFFPLSHVRAPSPLLHP